MFVKGIAERHKLLKSHAPVVNQSLVLYLTTEHGKGNTWRLRGREARSGYARRGRRGKEMAFCVFLDYLLNRRELRSGISTFWRKRKKLLLYKLVSDSIFQSLHSTHCSWPRHRRLGVSPRVASLHPRYGAWYICAHGQGVGMPGALPCSAHQPLERGLQVASLTRGRMTGRETQSWRLRVSGRGQSCRVLSRHVAHKSPDSLPVSGAVKRTARGPQPLPAILPLEDQRAP